jgi:capsular polysaccharide biosynthesis protein
VELEAESTAPNRSWTPVVPVPSETVAVAMFQWKRLPISRKIILRYLAYGLVIVVGCGALAYGLAAMGTKSYGARTQIVFPLNEQLASGTFLREDRSLATQTVSIASHAVLDPVAAKNHLSYTSLLAKEKVSILQDSEVIQIEIDDHSASQAQTIVGQIATEYLKQQPNQDGQAEAFINKQIAGLNTQLSSLAAQFNTLEEKRQQSATIGNPNPAETPSELAIANQVASDNSQVATLQSRLDTITVDDLQQPHVQQQTAPYVLSSPVSPKPLQDAAAGALAGIMLAVIVLGFLLRRLLKRQPLDQLD